MSKPNPKLNVVERLEIPSAGTVDEAVGDASQATAALLQNPADSAEPAVPSELDQLKAERDQLLDRVARLQAEFENARNRADRERTEFRDYAAGVVVEQFLPVLDNFQLALKSTASEHQLRSGVELIVKQMEEILRQMQVTPVPAIGEPFDPHVHEAIGAIDRDDLPDQHVAEEVRRGYKFRERLLRPALVRVAHNPKQTSD
jgi:molecular chaperone GrpE